MKTKIIIAALLLAITGLIWAAKSNKPPAKSLSAKEKADFQKYWQNGQAEISRFSIKQARYGELHQGHEVLVFVTENFLKDKQVKLDTEYRSGAEAVLKLNRIRRFTTGIYDYSMMTSVFKPFDVARFQQALKVTMSSQDWCGHTFLQFNNRGNKFAVSSYSYFELEGDEKYNIDAATLEDELLNTIRLSPTLLPIGKLQLIPMGAVLRLRHKKARVVNATATLAPYSGKDLPGKNLQQYSLSYENGRRKFSVTFEKEHPHLIAGFTDTYKSGWGTSSKELTTRAVRTHLHRSAYWQENSVKNQALRRKLGLPAGL